MKKLISILLAAMFVLSFSSVALASSGPEVHKTYYFDYGHSKSKDLTYDDFLKYYGDYEVVYINDHDDYRHYLEYRHSHKKHRMDYKEFLKWLELLKEKNHSFDNVYLQGYENGVAIYR